MLTNKDTNLISAHSMEEADYLCDRLGIFVDGSLQCIANSSEVISSFYTNNDNSNFELRDCYESYFLLCIIHS